VVRTRHSWSVDRARDCTDLPCLEPLCDEHWSTLGRWQGDRHDWCTLAASASLSRSEGADVLDIVFLPSMRTLRQGSDGGEEGDGG
jgi:hypothetical protein